MYGMQKRFVAMMSFSSLLFRSQVRATTRSWEPDMGSVCALSEKLLKYVLMAAIRWNTPKSKNTTNNRSNPKFFLSPLINTRISTNTTVGTMKALTLKNKPKRYKSIPAGVESQKRTAV